MYQIIQNGKTVNRRLSLRKAWIITIFSIIPLLLLCAIPIYRIHSYILAGLGLFIPMIEFRRSRKVLTIAYPNLVDWLILLIASIFICSGVFITGGIISPLLIFLFVPFCFSTLEFGLKMGFTNFIPMGIFCLCQILFYPRLPISSWLQLLSLLVVCGIFLFIFTAYAGIETHYHQKINRLINQDELTGLFNRRYLKARSRKMLKKQIPFALVMIDINYFKYFNDYWGHPRGDLLLIQVSRILRETLGENDLVVRYSGDEFIIVSPICTHDITGREQITQIIESITIKVDESHFDGAECFPSQTLTLAFGAALYPDDVTTYDGLIAAADNLLYQNKQKR